MDEGEIKEEAQITKRKIATTIGELPELPEDYVRVVHLTSEENSKGILEEGLKYENQGMAMSTASAWSNPGEVKYSSTDPRFSGSHIRAVVMDIPNQEWKLHNNITKSPGKIDSDRIVGVINPSDIK